MMRPCCLSVILLLLSCAHGRRVGEEDREEFHKRFKLAEGESELVFVRHGTSLNNVFKQMIPGNVWAILKILVKSSFSDDFEKHWKENSLSDFKRGYEIACHTQKICGDYGSGEASSLKWEIRRWSRDCLLHPSMGEEPALTMQKVLTTFLPKNFTFNKVFVSPLRRTLQTALAMLGHYMYENNTEIFPWIHEQYKSKSDLANDGSTNSDFMDRYQEHLKEIAVDYRANTENMPGSVKALKDGLEVLGDGWVDKLGFTRPGLPQPDKPLDSWQPHTFPLYPEKKGFTSKFKSGRDYKESKKRLFQRMVIVRRLLEALPPGRYAFVAHGGVGEALFGRKPANLGVISARFFPGTQSALDHRHFFHSIQLASDRWGLPGLPGWAEEEGTKKKKSKKK